MLSSLARLKSFSFLLIALSESSVRKGELSLTLIFMDGMDWDTVVMKRSCHCVHSVLISFEGSESIGMH